MTKLFATLAGTIVFSTLIAGFLSAIGFGGGFAINLVFSQCIGLSIAMLLLAVLHANLPPLLRGLAAAAGIVVGAALGGFLGRLLTGVGRSADGVHEAQSLLLGLVFGAIAAGFFWLRERNSSLRRDLQARELARLEAEKQALAARLRLLQAQIEPHFLFNSLANVAALIDVDPGRAGSLLDALIRYLRSSLQRTRAEGGSLGDEVTLLKAYLDILKIRMGDRLDYAFKIPPHLLGREFPPMLLQPLVENAIRHGLEPKLGGGFLQVDAAVADGCLRISVADDGVGIAEAPGEGVGLSNIRARLLALYGPAARLEVAAKVGAGVTATLDLPLEAAP
ncbi:histidine kinase [Sulfuritalea sp.]|uniref:sensor histidine kinase n=1 Tax=Sulfuritalea sp. TaxID=2480090 RepID=UPI001AD5AE2C|nr:histidine kinase [Sulfuritalea sp.]MBN8474491.1 histidine kinase [Sulfuritalea sp.]